VVDAASHDVAQHPLQRVPLHRELLRPRLVVLDDLDRLVFEIRRVGSLVSMHPANVAEVIVPDHSSMRGQVPPTGG
jgi:hypothetical protein